MPNILIADEVYQKCIHWVNKSTYEVSGLGTVEVLEDGTLHVVSAMLLKQENTGSHTEIEATAVCKAMDDLMSEDGLLKWWWHSHVDMPVFWSKTDTDTIQEWGEKGWVCATVFNQKSETRSAYYQKDAIIYPWGKCDVFKENIPTNIAHALEYDTKKWDSQYAENVTNQTLGGYWRGTKYISTKPKAYGQEPVLTLKELEGYGFNAMDVITLNNAWYELKDIKLLSDDCGFQPEEIVEMAEGLYQADDIVELMMTQMGKDAVMAKVRKAADYYDGVDYHNYENIDV